MIPIETEYGKEVFKKITTGYTFEKGQRTHQPKFNKINDENTNLNDSWNNKKVDLKMIYIKKG